MLWSNYWGCVPVSGQIKKKDYAKIQNQTEFTNSFMAFFTLCMEIFQWENLPDTCDARMLERFLLLNGQAMICKYNGAFLTLASAGGFDINLYGRPTKAWGYGLNGFNHQFNAYVPGAPDTKLVLQSPAGNPPISAETDAVICYDNSEAYPCVTYLMTDCQRMADLIRSTDVAVKTLKSPVIIGVNETEKNSMKQLMDDYEDNVFAILTAKGFSLDSIKVWPTSASPDSIEAIWNQYLNIQARLLSAFGINSNPNEDKKERLLVDEVNANNQYLHANLYKRLKWRRQFCEQVNEAFGLNISVRLNEEVMGHDEADDTGRVYEDDANDGAGEGDRYPGSDA